MTIDVRIEKYGKKNNVPVSGRIDFNDQLTYF
jgi:hypothetical protein